MRRKTFGLVLASALLSFAFDIQTKDADRVSDSIIRQFRHSSHSNVERVAVEVDAGKTISRINPYLYGLNVARWDEDLFPGPASDMLLDCDRDAIRKVREAGFTVLKYPGGNDADHYIWNSPDNSAGEMNTDEYAAFLKTLGAQGFITINFNEPPELAADWVRYCNKVKDYGIKYWEIGDEQWGTWAAGHTTPEKYAERFIEFAKAMKAVDPTIQVAADVKPTDDPNDWTCRVLKAAGNYIDLVTFSYYPLTNKVENADSLFASLPSYRRDYETIRHALQETLPTVDPVHGSAKADSMWIVNVGYNSVNGRPGPFTLSIANALWVGDMLGTMAELGEQMSCYWALHNSYPPGQGDYGILSEDGKNTPAYTYYVFTLYAHLFGYNVVRSSSTDSSLSVYSSLYNEDTLSIILINKDKRHAKDVKISLNGYEPEQPARVWVLDARHRLEKLPDMDRVGQVFDETVPPYALIVIHLLRKGTVLPPTDLALGARATASTYARNGPNFGPSSAVDGKLYTRWASAALWGSERGLDPQWFQVDLRRTHEFDKIVIHWANGYGIEYDLAVSVDGKKWKTVWKENNGRGGIEEVKFNPVEGRFVKLDGFKGSNAISSYSIYEFQIFNSKTK